MRSSTTKNAFEGHDPFSWTEYPWLLSLWVTCVHLFHHISQGKENRYVLAFLKSLVDCGLFEHVSLNSLPVGHEHCDISKLFSRIAD